MIIWLLISALLVFLDQLIKYIVVENIALSETIVVIPDILNFVYVKNTGAAFSMLSGKTDILSIVSLVVCIALIWYIIAKKPNRKLFALSLSMLLGGALGNLIDRMFKNFVVDYIEVLFINFPVFNLADIAITIGAVLLMIYVIFFEEKSE